MPEITPLNLALFEPDDDISADALAELARSNSAFDLLNDPRDDIYSATDGEAVQHGPLVPSPGTPGEG